MRTIAIRDDPDVFRPVRKPSHFQGRQIQMLCARNASRNGRPIPRARTSTMTGSSPRSIHFGEFTRVNPGQASQRTKLPPSTLPPPCQVEHQEAGEDPNCYSAQIAQRRQQVTDLGVKIEPAAIPLPVHSAAPAVSKMPNDRARMPTAPATGGANVAKPGTNLAMTRVATPHRATVSSILAHATVWGDRYPAYQGQHPSSKTAAGIEPDEIRHYRCQGSQGQGLDSETPHRRRQRRRPAAGRALPEKAPRAA